MKKFLKRTLGDNNCRRLKQAKEKVSLFLQKLFICFTKLFPAGLRLFVKSNLEVIKKMDYAQGDILLSLDSDLEHKIRVNSCRKEPEMIEWIHGFFKPGDVFYDIGANIGAYSLVAAKFLKDEAKIYAFEPGFLNFSQLCKNIFINGCRSIVPLQVALSNAGGLDTFNYNNLTPGGALHALGKPIDYKGEVFKPVFSQPVLSYRLDDFIEQFKIPVPNYIKIDVDSIEFEILKGAEKTLANPNLRSIIIEIIEMSEPERREIIDFLSSKGLNFYSQLRGENSIFKRS